VSDEELREKWGGDYAAYLAKIADAVRSTDGECLAYENAPIQAVFHSSSAGMTAESGEVWTFSLPYLASVASPESEETVPNYVSSVTVSAADLRRRSCGFTPTPSSRRTAAPGSPTSPTRRAAGSAR
jgi:stage II sporulation protein D